MAKSKKAVGVSRFYLEQTAKLIEYPVDIDAKTISVPELEIAEAMESLTVKHLMSFGFALQRCIAVEKKSVYDPTLKEKIIRAVAAEQAVAKVGDRFLVNDAMTLEVMSVTDDIAYLKAPGTMASPAPTSFSTIKEMLKREVWQRLT